jgi:hypothetical protein
MALTKEQLDEMQTELLRIFKNSSKYASEYPEYGKVTVMTVQAILAIENERRLSDDYIPRKHNIKS